MMDHLAMSGHSAGGGAIAGFGDRARVLIPMAAGGAEEGQALASTLVLGGLDDGIAKSRAALRWATPRRRRSGSSG